MKSRFGRKLVGLALVAAAVSLGCGYASATKKAKEDAQTKGKYHVKLVVDETVVGTCKFLRFLEPDQRATGPVLTAEREDYYRAAAVYIGADTVLVRGNIGEAYICGPGPLNPDGTLKDLYRPTPPPH